MSMPKVNGKPMPGTSMYQMQMPLLETTLNPEVFERQINSQGVRMIHSRPVPCPMVRDLYTSDHSSACNLCYNGMIYYDTREFVGAFAGNNLQRIFGQNGTFDMDTAQIIIPVHDIKGEIMDIQYFDQVQIPDFSVRFYQRIEHSQSGYDRAQFPVLSIDYVLDARGKRYLPGVDLIAEDGQIKWLSQNRPGYDAQLQRGVIYSINYYTKPVFTVMGVPHQLRMAQTKGDGQNVEARFPQLCIVRKDFIPFDSTDKKGPADRPEPRDASFSP